MHLSVLIRRGKGTGRLHKYVGRFFADVFVPANPHLRHRRMGQIWSSLPISLRHAIYRENTTVTLMKTEWNRHVLPWFVARCDLVSKIRCDLINKILQFWIESFGIPPLDWIWKYINPQNPYEVKYSITILKAGDCIAEAIAHLLSWSFLARGHRGFTKYWDGGSEMWRITGNKRDIRANSNLGFTV